MLHQFSRSELLLGKKSMEKLNNNTVAIFGIGGVGSYVAEGLARTAVGHFVLVDDDVVCLTNINRQLIATRSTVGRPKVEVMAERIHDINPDAEVTVHRAFYLPGESQGLIDGCDYVVDAIDTVPGKIALVLEAREKNIPIISCMGAGNKLDPTRFEVADLFSTSVCPLCKVMRKELKRRGVDSLKVVYSREEPLEPDESSDASCRTGCVCPKDSPRTCTVRRRIPGSVAFVPSVAGLILAGEVVRDLIARGAQPDRAASSSRSSAAADAS
jgi:tRNA A37 threonylcarbamoyladenosine dehydratase